MIELTLHRPGNGHDGLCLFVEIVHAGEFPAGLGFAEVVDYDFVAGRIGAANGEVLRVRRIDLWCSFVEAGSGVRLFVEDFAITLAQINFRLDGGNAVRHADRKAGKGGDGVDVLVGNGGFKLLPERVTSVVTAQQ